MRSYLLSGCALIIGFVLSGCDVKDLPPSSIAPICAALVGPIHYNTRNKMSQRYAAYLLALDIHQRNEIGRELNCPKYH
jgi:hypothetical protein